MWAGKEWPGKRLWWPRWRRLMSPAVLSEKDRGGFCFTAPAQPSVTVLPCIRPCFSSTYDSRHNPIALSYKTITLTDFLISSPPLPLFFLSIRQQHKLGSQSWAKTRITVSTDKVDLLPVTDLASFQTQESEFGIYVGRVCFR